MKITFISIVDELSGMNSRSLCAYVRSLGHESNIVFLPTPITLKSYSQAILEQTVSLLKDSDVVGISVITSLYFLAAQLSEAIREGTTSKILWGGIHTSICPEQCLEHADWVCVGEGELVLKSIVSGIPVSMIAGLWYKENGIIVKNGCSQMISDLSTLPYQNFTFDCHYLIDPIYPTDTPEKLTAAIYYERCSRKYQDTKGKYKCFYKTMTSRGCPYSCSYCNNSVHHSMYTAKHFRKRSIDQVLDELEKVCGDNDFIEYIHFADDSFLSRSTGEIIEFCRMYKDKISLPFRIIASPDTLNDEKLSHLINAGLCDVCMGIQSGSQHALKRYNRTIKTEQVLEATKLLNRYKDYMLPPRYDIICNDPFSSPDEERETIVFLASIPKPRTFVYFNLVLYPGTQLNELARNQGLLKDEIEDLCECSFVCVPTDFYDLLLLTLNLEYFPRWAVRILSYPLFYRATMRFPVLNKIAFGMYDNVIKKFDLLIHLIRAGEMKTIYLSFQNRISSLFRKSKWRKV